MAGAVAIKKPILRGHSKQAVIFSYMVSTACALFAGWSWKHWIADPRKKAYEDFYKTYNAEEEAERLHRMGLVRTFADNEDQPEEPFRFAYVK